jgi:hypothetical protein
MPEKPVGKAARLKFRWWGIKENYKWERVRVNCVGPDMEDSLAL